MSFSKREVMEEMIRRQERKNAEREKNYCPHDPTPKQREFLDLTCTEALYGGAAGGGKSDALLMAALQYVHVPGYAAMIFRKTFSDLALPEAIMDRSHKWLAGTDAHWSGEKKTWIFPSGATLGFGYMDNARDHYRYQGAELQCIGFDELTQFPEHQYQYMFSRLRRKRSVKVPLRMRAATNPGGIGGRWVRIRFIDKPADRVFIPAKLEDNPYLDKEEYEANLERLDETTRMQLRHGQWIDDNNLRIYHFLADDIVEHAPTDSGWQHVLGVDYGNVNATAFVVQAWHKNHDTMYTIESDEWSKLTPSDAADIAAEWNKKYNFYYIAADVGGLGKGYAEEARKRYPDLPIRAADKADKLGAIKLLNGDYERHRIKILKHNTKLIVSLNEMQWKDNEKLKENPTIPNHLCDANLYGWRMARHWRAQNLAAIPPIGTAEHGNYIQKKIYQNHLKMLEERKKKNSVWRT